jgi:3D (Asp-Asp-Asp) domain-containing protein
MAGVWSQTVETLGETLRELLAKIINRIIDLSPIAFALGCQGPRVEKQEPAPAATEVVTSREPVQEAEPKPIGTFDVTFYYVVGEEEVAAKAAKPANDNAPTELTAIAPPPADGVTLYERSGCTPIADVSREFAQQLILQGTGKLRDGRVVNVWGECKCGHSPCFKVLEHSPWGTAGSGRKLHPFRTVAVDRSLIKLGSLLYVPLLEGRTMPGRAPWGGFVHDGCVVADDTGGGIIGHQLDLFVGRKAWFLGLSGRGGSHAWARQIPVFDGSKLCERRGRKVGRKAGAI